MLLVLAITAFGSMVLLGVVQGVTEFLPVSSSGHLVVAQALLGTGKASLVEDVALHVGTLLAVVVFYRADLGSLLRGLVERGEGGSAARRTASLLLLANVPSAVVGIGFRDQLEVLFDRPGFVAVAFLATGAALLATRWARRGEGRVGLVAAVVMGLAQALAILPGFSRSGWTIAVGLFLGVRPAEAARFSFLMSIPAIGGAALLQARDLDPAAVAVAPLLAGVFAAAVVGLLCLAWLVRLVRAMALHRFTPYLWALAAVLAVALWRG